ncbi:hypothetical protein BCV70DRAFT_206830 [Testicularia cyperi]|uniref:Alanine--tRNA ligase n=1 Tax=Testicularia cyperi TaxID=1882483 RepID=A0A317XPQ0_9BASI|nr:hypothetical protein BCV70DRAFT_206830 [Testicularia cyperi]
MSTPAANSSPSTASQFGDWPATKVRNTFTEYFKERGHTFVPSSSTIPYDDPTLLFANAGMNQYKPIFLGIADPNSSFGSLKRAVNSQKCIRAGGKHNDLDDVGKDTYHHTFFEMLGNWSFGDYFKKEAIQMAWELLTKVYGLPADRLYVTYFEGDAKQGLEPDTEARDLWRQFGVPDDHILTGDAKDNFWEMGATGPCGPCSEIHYDRIGGRNAAHLVNKDDPNVIEIWNNVFMQFNREEDGSLRPLPAKHIDTGMGFERLVSILQDKPSNYDTDVFTPIFDKIQALTGARAYTGKLGAEDKDGIDTAYRVVADHVRTLTFAISDGGVPDRDGRGYVLRRILRRGTRYVRKYFQVPIGSFFSQLVPTLADQMGHFFPEITKKVDDVKAILDEEEVSFARTLDRGEKLFEEYASKAKADGKKQLSGNDVWRLYDTFGFPVDLTLIMAEEHGLGVNEKEFEAAQAESKELSKAGGKKNEADAVKFDVHDLGHLEKDDSVPKTGDEFKYGVSTVKASVKAIYQDHSFYPETSKLGDKTKNFGILLDRTCFYAESGGQQADTGSIVIDGKTEFVVEDAQVSSGYVLHIGHLKYGELSLNDEVVVSYDESRRAPLQSNHTATHILNFGLREVLGDHIDQKGSLVAQSKLRFDFSHKQGVNVQDLKKIEDISLDWIKRDVGVFSKEMQLDEAQKIPGLRAVFGEAYPNPVRVVTLEYDLDTISSDIENPKWRSTSVEFCGGTHVKKTGEIKNFVITEESGIAKGIRRIIAVTGEDAAQVTKVADSAEAKLAEIDGIADQSAKDAALKAFGTELARLDISVVRKAALNDKFAGIKKKLDAALKAKDKADAKAVIDAIEAYFKENPNATVYIAKFDLGSNMKTLQTAMTSVKKLNKSAYLFSQELDPHGTMVADGTAVKAKVVHVASVNKHDQDKGLDAKEWIDTSSQHIGGRGGGKSDSAQGVGEMGGKALDDAVEAARRFYTVKCVESGMPFHLIFLDGGRLGEFDLDHIFHQSPLPRGWSADSSSVLSERDIILYYSASVSPRVRSPGVASEKAPAREVCRIRPVTEYLVPFYVVWGVRLAIGRAIATGDSANRAGSGSTQQKRAFEMTEEQIACMRDYMAQNPDATVHETHAHVRGRYRSQLIDMPIKVFATLMRQHAHTTIACWSNLVNEGYARTGVPSIAQRKAWVTQFESKHKALEDPIFMGKIYMNVGTTRRLAPSDEDLRLSLDERREYLKDTTVLLVAVDKSGILAHSLHRSPWYYCDAESFLVNQVARATRGQAQRVVLYESCVELHHVERSHTLRGEDTTFLVERLPHRTPWFNVLQPARERLNFVVSADEIRALGGPENVIIERLEDWMADDYELCLAEVRLAMRIAKAGRELD